jgi:hypothetical protein
MKAAVKEVQVSLEVELPGGGSPPEIPSPHQGLEGACPIINSKSSESQGKRATGRPPRFRPEPGDAVALRGLLENPQNPAKGTIGPRIGRVLRYVTARRLLVQLRMGRMAGRSFVSWCQRPREVELANVARLATRREVILGFVDEPIGGAL